MKRQKHFLFLTLLVSALSSCVVIPVRTAYTVAGEMDNGALCAKSNGQPCPDLSFDEFLDFLEPAEATETAPARAGAVCVSFEDDQKQKTALEQACRSLGNRCSFETKQMIKRW